MQTHTAAEADHLHRAWRAEEAAIRREDTLWRWLRKHQLRRRKVKGEARLRIVQAGGAAADEAAIWVMAGFHTEEQRAEAVEVYREVRRQLGLPDRARRR